MGIQGGSDTGTRFRLGEVLSTPQGIEDFVDLTALDFDGLACDGGLVPSTSTWPRGGHGGSEPAWWGVMGVHVFRAVFMVGGFVEDGGMIEKEGGVVQELGHGWDVALWCEYEDTEREDGGLLKGS